MTAPLTPSILDQRHADVAAVIRAAQARDPLIRSALIRRAHVLLTEHGDTPAALTAWTASVGPGDTARGVFEHVRVVRRERRAAAFAVLAATAPATAPTQETTSHEHPDPTHHRRTRRGSGGGVPGPRR